MKILKWLGIVVLVLIVAVVGTVAYFKSAANARLARQWTVDPVDVPIPWPLSDDEVAALKAEKIQARVDAAVKAVADAATPEETEKLREEAKQKALADESDPLAGVDLAAVANERAVKRGQRLMYTRFGCFDCHGTDFAGKYVIDNPMMVRWAAPNITNAGVTKGWTGKDWVRILRHGVMHDGHTSSMPAIDYTWQSDREISDVAAYVKNMPAVNKPTMPIELGPVFAMLIATGKIPLSAERIDHTTPRAKLPPDDSKPSVELGKHVASVCVGCHRIDYSGGPIQGGDPSWPPSANLAGPAAGTKEQLFAALREGKAKDGHELSKVMPWQGTKDMTDVEIESIWMFLSQLPAQPTGT